MLAETMWPEFPSEEWLNTKTGAGFSPEDDEEEEQGDIIEFED